jgi:hypothetical protein
VANEFPAYLAWVRTLPYCACGKQPAGSVHHTGRSGMGQRPHDSMAVPLCQVCHVEELHAAKGWARGFEKRHVKAWERLALEATRATAKAAGWRFGVRSGKKIVRDVRGSDGVLRAIDGRVEEVF